MTRAQSLTFLAAGGEMGARMRELDWSATSVGPPEHWPQSLRSTISMLLPSKAQIILFWGPEFIVFYNDAYRPVFGAKHPRVLGLPGSRAWSEIWDTQLHALLAGVVRSGEAFQARDLLFAIERHGFVEETYFDVSYDPVRVESGEVGGVFCIVTETTERVVGERRMSLLRDLAARNATARTPHEACVLAIETLATRPEEITFAIAYLDDTIQAATSEAEERRARAAPNLVETIVIPPSATGGRTARLVIGLNPHRPFDEPYRSFLELVADQLGTALAHARAYETARMRADALAAIDRAKTAFFSNVSHEFRTPLTLMLGPVENLLDEANGPLTAAQRNDVEILRRNSIRLMKLVNSLLDFSRIEAGRAQATYVPTDVARATRDIAANFRAAIEKAGVGFEVSCETIAAPVFVDRDMWEKIVLNLLSNALKFTFRGTISVELRERDAAFELTIADTGVGIPAQELPRIFERFHRVEGTKSRTHEGTGIGLALTHELVRLHGGSIRVESQIDEGTRFFVTVPTGSSHLPPERIAATTASESPRHSVPYIEEAARWLPAVDASNGQNARILVVDDNADMRDYVCELLRGWEVATASNGLAALERARLRPPHLIITDVMMPELDGLELLQELRRDGPTRAIPVLMVSARAGEEARVAAFDAGADDYITKPFAAREFVARVRSLLKLSEARRDAELQKQHLRSLFMQAPTPIMMLRGPEHVIELANPQACQVWGRAEADVLNKPLLEAIPELSDQVFKRLLDDVLRTGEPYVGKETPARLERGGAAETHYFNFVFAPLRGVGGDIDGVLGLAFDVTDEVIARNDMNQLRVAAEAANRTKDEFLAMLGHELRNPLSPILTAIQIMSLRGDPSTAKEREVIVRQVRHLERLVDDLLDVSRIARGKIELRREFVDLADVVSAAIEATSPLLEQRQHRLEVRVPRPLMIHVDATRLTQVVVNILSNAAKYTSAHGEIRIEARNDGAHVELRVKDSGFGIAPEILPYVFEMFLQARQGLDRSHGGLGLGLTIVKNLVELHQGSVEARSDGIGKGSEFIVRLPAQPSVNDVARAFGDVSSQPARENGRRILIVDDNVDAAHMMSEALALLGHTTRLASNGPEALSAAAEIQPDIALLDLGLPLMDGYELAARLSSVATGRRPLLVAVTGYGQECDRERSRAAGFDAHVVKPVDLPRLNELLERLWEGSSAQN